MKKVLFLVIKRGARSEELVANLNKELGSDIQITLDEFSSVSFDVKRLDVVIKVGSNDITEFDLVYFRKAKGSGINYISLASTMAYYLDKKGIPYFDSLYGKIAIGDKLLSLVKLALSGLPVIPSLYYGKSKTVAAFPEISEKLGLPFIVKHPFLQKLKGVYVVKTLEDFKKVIEDQYDGYICQKFIDIKSEYRLLVLGGEVPVIHTKVKRSYEKLAVDYQDLWELGEYLDVSKFPKVQKDIAIEAAKAVNLEIAGVDIIVDKHENCWLVEANRGPGLYEHKGDYPAIIALADFIKKQLR